MLIDEKIGDLCGTQRTQSQVRWRGAQKNMLRSVNCWLFHVDRLDKEEWSASTSSERALAAFSAVFLVLQWSKMRGGALGLVVTNGA